MRVDPNYLASLTQSISASTAAEQRLTGELSSGIRVATLSDDPVAVADNVGLAGAIANIDAFTTSSATVQGKLQLTDSVLGEVVSQATSAISLAVSAGAGTNNSANLASIGQQVAALRDSIVQLANTSYQGQYLFSGSKGSTVPFQVDSSVSPATVTYTGDTRVSKTVTPDGQLLQTGLAGSSVFTAPGASLLGTLNQLVSDVASGSQAGIAADSSALTAALSNVTSQRSIIGSSLARQNDAVSYAATQATVLKAQQSTLLSADTAEVASSLSAAETQHQALLNTYAALDGTNLFSTLYR